MKADLHSHTDYSKDAITDIKTYLKNASASLDAIAVTDHDTMKGYLEIMKRSPKIMVIPGIEVATDLGDIIGLFLNEEIRSRTAREVIDEIKSQGGLSVLPHPFDIYRGFGNVDFVMKKIDCIEVFNSRSTFAFENKKALEVAKGAGKGMTGGSDAHTPGEIGRAYVESNASDLEGLRRDILLGRAEVKGKLSPPHVHLSSAIAKIAKKRP